MPTRERSGNKGGVGIFSYDLMASMVRCFLQFVLLNAIVKFLCSEDKKSANTIGEI